VYNKHCVLNADSTDGHDADLCLLPNETKIYSFRFVSLLEDIGRTLEVPLDCICLSASCESCSASHVSNTLNAMMTDNDDDDDNDDHNNKHNCVLSNAGLSNALTKTGFCTSL